MGRKSKADQRRIEIIEAFYRCVIAQGAANTSIRKIAMAAGMQPSVLHHYFRNREEIIEEAVVAFTDQIFDAYSRQLGAMDREDSAHGPTGRERMDRGMAFIFSGRLINEDNTGFFLECCVAARHNPRIRETVAELFRRFRRAIVEHLDRLPGADRLEPSQKELLASAVVSIHEGAELQWFADPSGVSLEKILETTLDLVDYFIKTAGASDAKGGGS